MNWSKLGNGVWWATNTTPAPDPSPTYTNQAVWYGWNSNTWDEDIQDITSAVYAVCKINRFYNQQSGNYASVTFTGDTFKYLTADTFIVGTAALTASGAQFAEGYYFITEESAAAPPISNAALDPDPGTTTPPDTYKIIRINASGNIAQITQYNILECQTQSLGTNITYTGSPSSLFTYYNISPSTPENLVCEMNNWIASLGNYTEDQDTGGGVGSFFLAGKSFEVGTTLYANGTQTREAGAYIVTRISPIPGSSPADIDILDPNKPLSPVPDSYQIVILDANGVIDSITQYNTVPCSVEVCSIDWTRINSSVTQLKTGGNIPILSTSTAWQTAYDNQTPAACYVDFDVNNASYGLLYNYYAKDTIQPPAGYRLPTDADYASLGSGACFTGQNYNRYGANPGSWDTTSLTDTTELGDTDLDIQGYGYARLVNNSQSFDKFGESEYYWNTTASAKGFSVSTTFGYLFTSGLSAGTTRSHFIRFVKII